MNNDDAKSIEIWNRVLEAALSLPGARIDRADFLRKELSKHFPPEVVEKAIATRPACAGIPSSAITSIAKGSIAWHKAGVSAVSFTVGLPGGWWIAGTVPADMMQFFWHVVVILQKLAYLYGWPEFFNEEGETDDQTRLIVTVFVGVMFGAGAASKILGNIAERVGERIIKRLPQEALTKWGLYQVAKEVAKWLGVKLTKASFAKYLARIIPVLSGFISGIVTWVSFSVMSKRLRMHPEELRLAKDGNAKPQAQV